MASFALANPGTVSSVEGQAVNCALQTSNGDGADPIPCKIVKCWIPS